MRASGYLIVGLAVAAVAALSATAVESRYRGTDRGQVRVEAGTADVDVSEADYTGFVGLLTIEPDPAHVVYDAEAWLDLDGAKGITDAFTLEFALQRKINGTTYRTISGVASIKTTIAASAVDASGVYLPLGVIDPDGDCRIAVKLGSESGGDLAFPYRVTYRSGAQATFTPVEAQ